MPLKYDVYTDPDMIQGLYEDPANEVLLAEYALSTGGVQMGVVQQGGGGSSDGVLGITEVDGQGGDGSDKDGHIVPILTA